jgi:CRP-like cAMP-binding protein
MRARLRRDHDDGPDAALHNAAWVARCVGRGTAVPLGLEAIEGLADAIEPVQYVRGSVVFEAGEPPSAVLIVRQGSLGLLAGSAPDRVMLAMLHPGDVDGDLSLLMGMPSPYRAEAIDDTECLRIPAQEFDRLLARHPVVARRWLTSIAGRLAASQQRLIDLLGVPLPQQVARVLLDESDGGQVPYAQATIAALLGARRPSVNKVVKDLESRGLLTVAYRRITVEDAAKLAAFAGRG